MATAGVAGCQRATAPGEAEAVFGTTGFGHGEFSYPRAIAIDRDGTLFVVDKAARIQRLGPHGQFEAHWRTPAFEFGKPVGLSVAPDGRLFVADTHYHRVLIYDRQGTLEGEFGGFGKGPGEFNLLTDVVVAPDGSIYVSEYGGNDRISRFDSDHRFVRAFGSPDEPDPRRRLSRPNCLALDPDGTLWVADACNHRIVHFDPDGKLLGEFGRHGSAPGELAYPYGVDLLADGTLVVAEFGNARVQRFDRTGRSLGAWGSPGREVGQLAYPWSLAVGPDDRIYVVDSGNNRIQVIRM